MRYETFKKVLEEAVAIIKKEDIGMVERVWEHFEANGINVNLDQVDQFIKETKKRQRWWH